MYCIHLDLGLVYQADGTKQIAYTNSSTYDFAIARVSLWGGISIGAIMDFSTALYVTGPEYNLGLIGGTGTGWNGAMPLAYMSLDRYGDSNGQPYQKEWDWAAMNIHLHPGQQLILQSNCIQHGVGNNLVTGTPYANDNCQAQAYVWMS